MVSSSFSVVTAFCAVRKSEIGGGDAVGFFDELVGVVGRLGEGLKLPVEDRRVGRVADVLDREAQAHGDGGVAQTLAGDEVEELVAVSEDGGGRGDRVPEHVAEAAQGGGGGVGGGGDGVPVGGDGFVLRRADELEAVGRLFDLAAVEDGQGHAVACA
jgi:hypothetical protein